MEQHIVLKPNEERTVEVDPSKHVFHYPQGERHILTTYLGQNKFLFKNTSSKKEFEVKIVPRTSTSHE